MSDWIGESKDSSMKKLIILLLAAASLAAPTLGYKQEDLEKLKSTMVCVDCDLKEAPSLMSLNGKAIVQEYNVDAGGNATCKMWHWA